MSKELIAKVAGGLVVVTFVAGGGYSVWRHEKMQAPANQRGAAKTESANLIDNVGKFRKVASVPKKTGKATSDKASAATGEAAKPAPQYAPFQPTELSVHQAETAPGNQESIPPDTSAAPVNSAPEASTSTPDNSTVTPPAPTPEPAPAPTPSEPIQIAISEILFNATGGDQYKEFVELYNPTNADADLKNWSLKLGTTTQSSLATFGSKAGEATLIKAHGFLLIGFYGYNQSPSADMVRSVSLPNTSSAISLYTDTGVLMDQAAYDGSIPEGNSWERQDYTGGFHAEPVPNPQNSASPAIN